MDICNRVSHQVKGLLSIYHREKVLFFKKSFCNGKFYQPNFTV